MAKKRRTECFIIELCELCSRWPDSDSVSGIRVRDATVISFAPLPCWLRSSQANLWQSGPIRNCISRTGKQQRRERNVGRVFTREPEAVIDGPLSRSQSGTGRMAQNKGARGGTGACDTACDCWGLRSKGVCVLGVGLQPRLGQCNNRGDGRRKYIFYFLFDNGLIFFKFLNYKFTMIYVFYTCLK